MRDVGKPFGVYLMHKSARTQTLYKEEYSCWAENFSLTLQELKMKVNF